MKKLLCLALLLMLGALAFGQTNLPPCSPFNVPPNCTDYFGVANWANSPLPAGSITGFTIVAAGSGYATPVVVITDTSGAGATAPTITLNTTGGIATVVGGGGGTGYIAPQVTIVDVGPLGTLVAPTCGGLTQPACGSGAMVAAVIGAPLTAGSGIRKFVDTLTLPLANLQIAVPDTITFPGSDYYVIALQEYSTKMHTDLPATKLRGYVQLNNGTAPNGTNTLAPPPISYLGPTIIAVKNRPVRVLFKNQLPTGLGGNLFIPVDTTYMGAGAPYTQNRATLHLHGGATPWISDGTPHQWTVPVGETGVGVPQRGDSVQMVPDMYFDSLGNAVPFCTATVITSCYPTALPVGATNDPGQGNLTFFWTNQQGGRLMFYHDHAYGLTRLNVYAGEAAGYLLVDPVEEHALAAATVPGVVDLTTTPAAVDLAHLVPLVIQDKTFVPSAAQLAAEDPTWTPGGFGTTPGLVHPGDLWFPHVYTPNQNPADVGGANAFGRWDYGPWTLPGNQTVLLAATPTVGNVTIPCTSSAFPNQAVNCPITPNPSGTPESFMDTPLVNGKAYPVLHVAPAAYRFRILSAGNDRSLNLQLYVADPLVTTPDGRTNTEVKMVPAIQPAAGALVPLCSQITPITNNTLFMGLATGLLDATGNPINGTGLAAGCWPNFGAGSQAAGIPVQQTMWAADGRAGGVPDPTTAGPPFIQIGTEGGLLPAPVVIPSMPIGYEANTRSVTITNVSVHGLWIGPAERVDAVVDFSKFSGKTLILYNDAPTPAPAIDSRTDYFTGDGDQTSIGGAPNTLPGYGPNTRTIMQIVVDPTVVAPNTVPFSLATLSTALPAIFAQTQPVPIVPEPTYPPASGAYSAIPTYSLITDATLSFFPIGSTTSVTYTDDRKAIQELFTLDYGRMNATLGTELPLTNFLTQTTIPLGYIDPPTEIIKDGETQLWHITHNGVDTHFIHFHLFNVQVINRSAWDGTKRPPDQNELGWKDTVRMNPLEDILVALKPIQPVPPFPVRDSYRLMDVTMPVLSDCAAITLPGTPTPAPCSIFTDVNPFTNVGAQTPNKVVNLGWEYVWHCHILGHEENDMMRAIAFNVPPEAPSNLVVAAAVLPATGLNLSWTDNSASETGFTLERATDAAFTLGVVDTVVSPLSPDANGQGITWGATVTSNDAGAGAGPYFYRVRAFKPDANYWIASPNITSAWSNTVSFGGGPFASVSPAALAFGSVALPATSAPLTVTLSNTGTGPLTISTITPTGDFAVSATTCLLSPSTLAGGSNCSISVTFTPTLAGPRSGTLTITDDSAGVVGSTQTVALTGTGGTLPVLTITANSATMRYGSAVPALTFAYNPPNPLAPITPPVCTTTATTTSPVGTYPITCAGAVDANYSITYVAGTMSVTPAPLTIWASNGAMTYGGVAPTITASYVGLVAGDTPAIFAIPTTPPIVAPTCIVTPVLTTTTPVGNYPSTCSGAVDPNYTISYAAGVVTVRKAALTITATATRTYGTPNPPSPFTLTGIGLVPPDTIPSLGIAIICNTTATIASPVGSYPITCTGPAFTTNYNITYAVGTLTVTGAPLTITASSGTMVYGGVPPVITPTFSAFVLGQTNLTALTTQPTCSTVATSASPVGSYASNCAGAVAPNYVITYVAGSVTVTPAALTVTAVNATMVYGGPLPTFTATATGLVGTDTLASLGVICTSTATVATPVGIYPNSITCSGITSANYTVTYVAATLTITPATLTVTANNLTKTYGQTLTFLGTEFTTTGLVNGNSVTSVTLTSTGAPATAAVGPYPIVPSAAVGTGLTNYTINYVNGTLTVNPAALVITANNASKTYGQTATFLGTAFTVTGLLNGNSVTSVTLTSTGAPAPAAVGAYPIVPSAAVGTGLTNYTITYATTGTLTVNPAGLTITASNASKTYGQTFAGTAFTVSGLLNGNTVTSVTLTSAGALAAAAVGTYPIVPSAAVGTGLTNYTITYVNGTLTVNRAALTVTAPNPTRVWGFANPALTPVITGFVNGQTSAVLTAQPTCTTPATATSAVGSYPITCSGGAATNYTFLSYVPGTLTVTTAVQLTPASLTFAVQNLNTNSPFQAATLRNIGGSTMTFSAAITANFNRGGGGGGNCGTTLAAAATCTINVRFRPTTTGVLTGTLTVTSALAGSGVVALSGTGNGAVAAVAPATTPAAPHNFGGVTRGQVSLAPLTVTVTNNGTTPMTFNAGNGFTLGGTNAGQFRLTTGGSCVNGGTLPALGSCTLTVNFAPTLGTALGTKNATVTIRSNATNGNQFVYVRGIAQ